MGLKNTLTRQMLDQAEEDRVRYLFLGIQFGLISGVVTLIECGVDVNAQDDEGMTPLHHAAALGARSCLRLLVNSGKCDYLIKDKYGRYASELAIEWGRDAAVARLLAKKQVEQACRQGVPAWIGKAKE